ncbi:50S ribosomal protein L11 methyltransferase [Rhizobium sp. S96]|uniref:class I SAM-dependent methyltransferase n=1 Tax=Rhizobium sp. S96 TaxID=3055140 RepID=UPI0025AB40BA|nr:50S ribosomal protein L11 methyltransferase [Rhizobium sp. S96]MDM9622387.1 50S ribosomal protein L11 methyltransferase [Rhizobium sp. S96]
MKPFAEDARAFIQANLRLLPVPGLPGIWLYMAHPGSGLSRLARRDDDPAPYWAYCWAGGAVLAHHILANPALVRGRRVLDLGAGSGIVAIAAARCGAVAVKAVDIDANAIAAIGLNAEANGFPIEAIQTDMLSGEPPDVDIILAGDVFYDRQLADRALPFLARCTSSGIDVLIGDPRRAPLPRNQLRLIAEYAVPDFGDSTQDTAKVSGVFAIDQRV